MYINKVSTINLNTVTVSAVSLTSLTSKGGLLYISSNAVSLSAVTLTSVTASNVLSRATGSMIHSESASVYITATSSSFNCHTAAFSTPTDYDLTVSQVNTYGGAFYIKNANKFTSTGNQYNYCYLADKGGVFYLENTWLVDTGSSTFTSNAAVTGGAIHCESCTGLDLKATTFTTHEAFNGGLISMVSPPTSVNLDYITVTGATSRNLGGMIYTTGTLASPLSTVYVKNTVAVGSDVVWTNLYSVSHGGGWYIDHANFNVAISVSTKVTNSKSENGKGGFFYILNSKAISITSSTFLLLESDLSGSFLYSEATTLALTVTSSTIDCSNQGVTTAFTDLSADLTVP